MLNRQDHGQGPKRALINLRSVKNSKMGASTGVGIRVDIRLAKVPKEALALFQIGKEW